MKLVCTPSEAAEMLATSPNKVYELLEAGEIKAYKQGSLWKIPTELLREYVITKAEDETWRRKKDVIVRENNQMGRKAPRY